MKPIHISATVQDSGKTAVSLGLMQVLRTRGLDPGYCKPVGQHYIRYDDSDIDEDAALVHQYFNMPDKPCHMSPIAIRRGFTRDFINNPNVKPLEDEILRSIAAINKNHPMLIAEGTGHAGVGSCFGLSNARVAQLIGAEVLIVTAGGIGRPMDELALNLALFQKYDVNVMGVVLNKIRADKYEKVTDTVTKGLKLMGTRLLGAMPYESWLESYTVKQLADELKFDVYCGHDCLSNTIENTVIAAMEPEHVVKYIQDNTLIITPGDRIDNMLVSLMLLSKHGPHNGGMILTGGFEPHKEIIPFLQESHIPVLISDEDTFSVSAKLANIGFKIRPEDGPKIDEMHELVEKYVEVDKILGYLEE
ncbi:Phosphate acetyltransferase [Anaerohalosphaera lusitana]|uniref:Phosphate acetyltransferase n=1 Tax=Anaerohalosphaera lusitana TaxID=1936003 RepID=A0A1U9NLN3_9BACT|nr:AAA family ATPase [Anaerohalosphaera lusitana]AQT68648.1 Phosphate acetyltransferase [Anaerohalosphaera lusitana]